ncbi:hypothetical protein LPJ75_006831, partial [Coemansia sp. RSA 2598]
MALQDYEYGDDFVEVKRVSYAGNPYGNSDLDLDKAYAQPAIRRLKRDRAES